MTSPEENPVNAVRPEANLFEQHFYAVLREASAIPEDQLVRPTTDALTATGAVFNKLPALAELRPRAALLPEFSLHDYDQLGPRTYALSYAESRYQMAVTPPPPIDEKLASFNLNKDLLHAECNLLAMRGCIPAAPVDALKFTTGVRHTAANSRHMIVYLREKWADVSPHTTMTPEDLRAMEAVVDELDVAIAQREDQQRKVDEATLTRRQMFTLVYRSLGEVERAVDYYHAKEFDTYMPNIFAKHGRRRSRGEGSVEETPVPTADPPAASVKTPAFIGNPLADADPVPIGMPGSNPLSR